MNSNTAESFAASVAALVFALELAYGVVYALRPNRLFCVIIYLCGLQDRRHEYIYEVPVRQDNVDWQRHVTVC